MRGGKNIDRNLFARNVFNFLQCEKNERLKIVCNIFEKTHHFKGFRKNSNPNSDQSGTCVEFRNSSNVKQWRYMALTFARCKMTHHLRSECVLLRVKDLG